MDDRIVDTAEHGEQIELTCKNHPNLRWQTKNIAPIGCRRIFFDLFRVCEGYECNCPASDLIPVPKEG